MAVQGSKSLIVLMVSLNVKQRHKKKNLASSELWSCVKVEVAVLGFQSLTVLMVSVDVRQKKRKKKKKKTSFILHRRSGASFCFSEIAAA